MQFFKLSHENMFSVLKICMLKLWLQMKNIYWKFNSCDYYHSKLPYIWYLILEEISSSHTSHYSISDAKTSEHIGLWYALDHVRAIASANAIPAFFVFSCNPELEGQLNISAQNVKYPAYQSLIR